MSIQQIIKSFSLVLIFSFQSHAQNPNSETKELSRTFMPSIQLGYVTHGSDQLSGGLMVQTSIEYRHASNFVFRINYDDFNSNMEVEYPLGDDLTFTGRTTFVEFIGGVGYRDIDKGGKHHFTGYVQGGIRNYGYPVLTTTIVEANLDYNSRTVGIMRYSLGYEYAFTPKLFFVLETLASHTLEAKDFWEEDVWSYGFTAGITAPLF